MATKPKKVTRKPAKKPTEVRTEATLPDNAPVPVGRTLNDARADGDAVIGHFVDVTGGEYEGRYGVLLEVDGDTAVVRGRDNDSDRFTTKYSDLVPAQAGRR